MRISLHHLTIAETTPAEFADIAASLGCDHVCLFIKIPPAQAAAYPYTFPRVQSVEEALRLKQRLSDLGLSVCNVDTFIMQPGLKVSDYSESLEIAAALGGRAINALNLFPATELYAAANLLHDFAPLAERAGLSVVLEWFKRSSTDTLKAATELVQLADNTNVGLNVDVLHLLRNGNQPQDLVKVDPSLMKYAQICDGLLNLPDAEQGEEAIFNRHFPGTGEFPLVSFAQQFAADTVMSIEAPTNRLRLSLSPKQRATSAVDGTRRILAQAAC